MSIMLMLCLCILSCSSDNNDMDPEQMARLTSIRNRLKEELGESYNKPLPTGTPAQMARGEQLYDQMCASCHGLNGQGLIHTGNDTIWKPADFTDKKQASFFSEQARLEIIKNGIKGTPMPGWQNVLNQEDIMAVYQYIKSMSEG
jgi:mono/diheme cytochrome c family protein